ncbi:hypothetical protein LCM20_09880 [Halobacillus litoralis]|uniref:hypothetical protein n=1 Tax=Halobacillus litoralis TaxID=45668 RepID=UPI001CD1D96A|nr:hypothetical protein [Halobacillus litoralis]MCA0970899.1 hypothetical protein [Halobacillus litoralis]
MNHRICEKCEGDMVKCYVDQGMRGILVKNADGDKLFSNKKNTRINPFVCGDCGWVEWYADEPGKIR